MLLLLADLSAAVPGVCLSVCLSALSDDPHSQTAEARFQHRAAASIEEAAGRASV